MHWPIRATALVLGARIAACGSTSTEYCTSQDPLPPPEVPGLPGGGLDGFDSPYLGHTGSWDGKGGAGGGASKNGDMDKEVAMGLRWTFMPVYWSAMEPDGPVDLSQGIPAAWQELDRFVIDAHARKLNVLMQAPVMGGNAGQPPAWAGQREADKSAPLDMQAAADFAGKLAARYRPGGVLATQQGWGATYGVRAWELDNEPNGYKVHWADQGGDYAEFVTRSTDAIRAADPQAVILAPSLSVHGGDWAAQTLDAPAMQGSPTYVANGVPYSSGPSTDVVSFHVYEGLNDLTIDCAFTEVQDVYDAYQLIKGFEYPRKLEYWHTEGNYDFFGRAPEDQRANWRWQFMARAFAAGVRKVNVMDAAPLEQQAMQVFVRELPNPFPMRKGNAVVVDGQAWALQHLDADTPAQGQVWVLWAENGSSSATVEVPVVRSSVRVLHVDGSETLEPVAGGRLTVTLAGDELSPPVMVVDRP